MRANRNLYLVQYRETSKTYHKYREDQAWNDDETTTNYRVALRCLRDLKNRGFKARILGYKLRKKIV